MNNEHTAHDQHLSPRAGHRPADPPSAENGPDRRAAHPDHAAMAGKTAPAGGHDHAAMMADPRNAAAMERGMRDRFLVSFLLTIPVVLYSELGEALLGGMPPAPFGLPAQWMGLLLATPIIFYGGWVFLAGTVSALRNRRLDMSVLITTGVSAAYLFSVGITIGGGEEVFFEAAAMLITFVLFGHWMEMRSRKGTTEALRALLAVVPEQAIVVRGGVEVEVSTADVLPGDLVRIRPGQRVPVDGVIESGRSSIDEALVTGESLPVVRDAGDTVVAGSVNGDGSLLVRASGTGSETVLGRIIALVQNAQASKAPAQRLADRAAAVLVIVAIGSGALTFAGWLAFSDVSLIRALTFAIAAVVIACPDALGLATPTAVAVGTGLGARHKVLIKDAATLERVSSVDAIVLDKTGTITEGRPRVVEMRAMSGFDERTLLALAAGLEASSSHPLAAAIVAYAHESGIHDIPPFQEAANLAGYGTSGTVEGRRVIAGNVALLEREGVDTSILRELATQASSAGRSIVAVAIDGQPAGVFALADTVRPSARETVRMLLDRGINVALLTGDNQATADAVAAQVGIGRVFADVKPGDKADYVRRLQSEGSRVAMVGDGINDAPALAAADIGIAIGAGTDVAIETASVVLMRSEPADVLKAIDLSKATVRKMKQNLFWASIYNVLAIPVAAGALFPATGIALRPEVAALLMSVSSMVVATNAVLLRREGARLDAIGAATTVPPLEASHV